MPTLDMSDALTDPQTLDVFTVIRREEAVSGFGEAVIGGVTFPNQSGVVYPTPQDELKRLPDQDLQGKCITILTRFALRGASVDSTQNSFKPDIIVWSGNNYIVRMPGDWGRYGAGFIEAICEMTDLSPVPPTVAQLSPAFIIGGAHGFPLQAIAPTLISPTQLTIPVSRSADSIMLFRNGNLQPPNPPYYSISGNTITLVTPLLPDDTVFIYA